jgi:cell division septation protein DedD
LINKSSLLRLLIFALLSLPLQGIRAEAFSLGKIRVTGSFDEAFRAEIPVRTDGQEGLMAQIGSAMEYEKIDADRPNFLDKFKISIGDHPLQAGQKMIYVRCGEPIVQPSFNLLIVARLGGGVIMENYFLALDLQKNVSLSLPSQSSKPNAQDQAGDPEDLNKVAAMMRTLRPGARGENPPQAGAEPATATVKTASLLDQIRREEEEAVANDKRMTPGGKPPAEERPAPVALAAIPEVAYGEKIKVLSHGFTGVEFASEPMNIEQVRIVSLESSKMDIAMEEPAPVERPGQPTVERVPPKVAVYAPSGGPSGPREPVFRPEPRVEKPRPSPPAGGKGGYIVVGGDNLFKIVSSLGLAKGGDLRVAAAAMWMVNKDKFIRGNMNGLAPGKNLDSSSVAGQMNTLSRREANSMIRQQWLEWKGGVGISIAKAGPAPAHSAAPPKKEPATAKPEPEPVGSDSGQGRPFVVHVASFKTREHSAEYVRLLRARGFNAFEIVSDVPGKGVWRRVVVDRLGDMRGAKALGQAIKKSAISDYTQVLKLPFAISIGGPAQEPEARALLKKFEKQGLAPYALRDKGAGGYTILVGAYENKSRAQQDLALLSGLDLQPKIVQP